MSNFTQKIAAAAIAVTALAGSMAATTTAVVTTTAVASAITATPAFAKECKTSITKNVFPKLHTRGGQRRGLRRAKRQWRKEVKIEFGSKFASFGKATVATNQCQLAKGKMKCTVTATPCS